MYISLYISILNVSAKYHGATINSVIDNTLVVNDP